MNSQIVKGIPGSIIYTIDGKYDRFESCVRLKGENGKVEVTIKVDGKKVFNSGLIDASVITMPVVIGVDRAEKLELIVNPIGDVKDNEVLLGDPIFIKLTQEKEN